MTKREFKLLSPRSGQVRGTYTGSCPHQAALKAATKGHTSIMLREHYGNANYGPKVHVFQGGVRPLSAAEKTPFSRKMGMTTKSVVKKMGCM